MYKDDIVFRASRQRLGWENLSAAVLPKQIALMQEERGNKSTHLTCREQGVCTHDGDGWMRKELVSSFSHPVQRGIQELASFCSKARETAAHAFMGMIKKVITAALEGEQRVTSDCLESDQSLPRDLASTCELLDRSEGLGPTTG